MSFAQAFAFASPPSLFGQCILSWTTPKIAEENTLVLKDFQLLVNGSAFGSMIPANKHNLLLEHLSNGQQIFLSLGECTQLFHDSCRIFMVALYFLSGETLASLEGGTEILLLAA